MQSHPGQGRRAISRSFDAGLSWWPDLQLHPALIEPERGSQAKLHSI